jgi:hypothetical protein
VTRSLNKPLQRSGIERVLGCGQGEVVLEQVMRARILKRLWPAAERGCSVAMKYVATGRRHPERTRHNLDRALQSNISCTRRSLPDNSSFISLRLSVVTKA